MTTEDEARAAAEARYPLRLPYNAEFERQAARADGFVEGYLAALASRVSTPPSEEWEYASALRASDGELWDHGTDANPAPAVHESGCEEWCNHCALCGTTILYGARCHQHESVYPAAPSTITDEATIRKEPGQ